MSKADLINAISRAMCSLEKARRLLENATLNGKQVELQSGETHIQWRYVGDTDWIDLIAIEDLSGYSAYEVAVSNGFVGSETDWLSSLIGKDGKIVGAGDYFYSKDMPEHLPTFGQVRFNNEDLSLATIAYIHTFDAGPSNMDITDWLLNLGAGTSNEKSVLYFHRENFPADFISFNISGAFKNGDVIVLPLSYLDSSYSNSGLPVTMSTTEKWIVNFSKVGDKGDSAYQVAVNNGFTGTEAEWLLSLIGRDGLDGTNGTNGTNGANGTSYLKDIVTQSIFPANSTEQFEVLAGASKWSGGVLAPNGKIYCVPYSGNSVLIIDPATNTADLTSITGVIGSAKYRGAILAPNGKIYAVPYSGSSVLIIDPVTDTAEQTSIAGLTGSFKWFGGVLAPNGKIYCVPADATTVLIINPLTNTAEQTSITGLTGSSKWFGGVLAQNGNIYCVPYSGTSVLIINPLTNTAEQTSITGLTGTKKWLGGVLASNGKIYCVPFDASTVLIIDPATNTAEQTSIVGLVGTSKWSGGILAPNGKIYCVAYGATTVLIIDPVTNTAEQTSITGLTGATKWSGAVLAPNGKIYCVPFGQSTFLSIITGIPTHQPWMLAAHFNKL